MKSKISNAVCLLAMVSNANVLLSYSATASEVAKATKTVDANTVRTKVSPQSWKYKNEQQWIVDSVARDIAEMLVFAKYHNDKSVQETPDSLNFKTIIVDAKQNKYKFEIALPKTKEPLTFELTLDHYAWSPTTYQRFAKKLLTVLQLKSNTPSATPESFLKILSDADLPEIYKENKRISAALNTTPLDPSLHEQAALLQATVDMLELAGNFSDTRPPLNRMAAHLAIAQALGLNSELNLTGKIADIALESMSCRDGVAVSKNDVVAKTQTDPIVNSWLRGLKIRSTGDFRIYDEKNATPLESSQFGMRMANAQTALKTLDYIEQHSLRPTIRWQRIAMCSLGSVSSGHQIDAQILPAEVEDFTEDYKAFNDDTIKSNEQFTHELNKTSTRCLQSVNGAPQLLPLSWDDRAASHARHILWAVDREYHFTAQTLYVPEAGDKLLKDAEKSFGELTLFPIIYAHVRVDQDHAKTNDRFYAAFNKLCLEHPELISAYSWNLANFKAKAAKPPRAVQIEPEVWFSPPFPMGTAFYFVHRVGLENFKPDLAEITRLRTLCPMSEEVCEAYARLKYGKTPTGDQMKEAFGALGEFNLAMMNLIAQGYYGEPKKFETELEKLAGRAPEYFFELGDYCVRHSELEKAAHFYQLGFDKAEDRVFVSNRVDWLVTYYYTHNQKEKALEIAGSAAGTYSGRGLYCLATLYERMGELKKSEDIYEAIKQRYGQDHGDLTGLYLRNKEKDKHYAEKADAIITKAFPNGMKKLDITQLPAPPTVGLVIKDAGHFQESLGLANGFIVVGLNGYTVESSEQYQLIRMMATDPKMKLTFWDGKKYRELDEQTVKDNIIGFTYEQYPVKPKDPKDSNNLKDSKTR